MWNETAKMFLRSFAYVQKIVHRAAKKKNCWPELEGVNLDDHTEYNSAVGKIDIGVKLELIDLAISQTLKAAIKGEEKLYTENDKDCPQFNETSIKLADVVILIMDLCEALGIPLAGAILSKIKHNKRI